MYHEKKGMIAETSEAAEGGGDLADSQLRFAYIRLRRCQREVNSGHYVRNIETYTQHTENAVTVRVAESDRGASLH